jgi:hypothetical protein
VRPLEASPGPLTLGVRNQGFQTLALATSLAAAALAGCSGSASSEFSGDLFIDSCSLACTDGSGGDQVFCSIVDVTENQEISILFSEPIDPSSVNASSLQVIDVNNGTTPDGLRFVDPLNANRVIFRPTVSFETGVNFSFLRNRSYEILVPGVAQGDAGPFIRSIVGSPNQSRLLCTVLTSQGVSDTVPGDPAVQVFVDVIEIGAGGTETLVRTQIQSDFATKIENISLTSNVYFEFNELMNLPTVANNQFMTAPFISVELDGDGNLATGGADRTPIEGSYQVTVDQELLTTSLLFVPTGGFPAAAVGDPTPSLIVVRIPSNVRDIAQNPVTTETGGGTLVGVAQRISFDSVVLPDEDGENFDVSFGMNGSQEAGDETGALWGSGILAPGLTGGTGRHGSLRVAAGETVTLNTDSQIFPMSAQGAINVIGNIDGTGDYLRSITETSGVFEFTTLQIAAGGRLVLTGSKPARVLVRGQALVSSAGLIDVSGRTAPTQDSFTADNDDFFGDPGNAELVPTGGPNGSTGGLGGDRVNNFGNPSLIAIGGIENVNSTRSGRSGAGLGNVGSVGRGNGGPAFPVDLPTDDAFMLPPSSLGDLGFNLTTDPLGLVAGTICASAQMGGVGSGGGYAFQGSPGIPTPEFPDTDFPAMQGMSPGTTGSNGTLVLEPSDPNNTNYSTRILRWEENDLIGGASGGGGGNHVYGTKSNVVGTGVCSGGFTSQIDRWNDHSGAAGGGGGGALEVLAGRSLTVAGSIDVSGGDGGSSLTATMTQGSFAMPGGGGSGGSLRLRAPDVNIVISSTIDISGGAGGDGLWSMFTAGVLTQGGAGGAGLVRVEDNDGMLTFGDVETNLLPSGLSTIEFLSVAPGYLDASTLVLQRPDSISGATSCWLRPLGAFQSLAPRADAGTSVADQGWTMDVVLGGGVTRPFRGGDPGVDSWETEFGNLLGSDLGAGEVASPIIVRFQGARSIGQILSNGCDVNLNDFPNDQVQTGSVTPWVAHPADLGLLLNSAGAPFSPTMIRYIVMFDRTNDPANMDTPGLILTSEGVVGVDNLRIEADPQ